MKYAKQAQKYRYFVYRIVIGSVIDPRVPISGITSHGHDEIEAYDVAFRRAYQLYPCRPNEMLVLVTASTIERSRQAWLLERSKMRADAEFEELMTVEG